MPVDEVRGPSTSKRQGVPRGKRGRYYYGGTVKNHLNGFKDTRCPPTPKRNHKHRFIKSTGDTKVE